MTTGTLEQTFEFSLHGVEVPSTTTFNVPALQLTAQLELGAALRLKVRVMDTAEHEADRRANDFAQELYRRLLLRFARIIERSEPPRAIHRTFTTDGTSPVTTATATITGKASIIRPNLVLLQPEVDAVAKDVELRVRTPQPATSAQLYTAIAMYATGLESQNKVVRFLVFYSALALVAFFKWHDGKQQNVDKLLLERNSQLTISPSPKNVNETLYTKLRNDLIHAEGRGRDPAKAITAIEAHIDQFQHDVSLVFSNL
jgi:hypothetical protein